MELAGEIHMQEPELFTQIAMKRSVDFKDPSYSKKPNTQLWNSINNIPKEKVKMYVRPNVLARDRDACTHILKKLEEDKVTEAIQ